MFIDEDEDTIVVELYAQQFKWTARVAGEDNVLGKANVRLIDINTNNTLETFVHCETCANQY